MARLDWDADRGRRMTAPQRREAAARFMDWIIEARTGPVIPEPVKKRKPRRKAKPARARKPKSLMLHRAKKPPACKVPVDPRAKMLKERRVEARRARAAGITQHPVGPPKQPSFTVEYRLPKKPPRQTSASGPIEHLGADLVLALRN